MKKSALFILSLLSCVCMAQDVTLRIREYHKTSLRYIKLDQLDSIDYISNNLLFQKDLNSFEKQFVYHNLGLKNVQIGMYDKAILEFNESLRYFSGSKASISVKNQTLYYLGDAYFTKQQYKKAYFYVNKCIQAKGMIMDIPNIYINAHSIVGYYHYINLDYKKSVQEYTLAEQKAKLYLPCKMAEVLLKKAKVLSKLSKFYDAKNYVDQAKKISDSC